MGFFDQIKKSILSVVTNNKTNLDSSQKQNLKKESPEQEEAEERKETEAASETPCPSNAKPRAKKLRSPGTPLILEGDDEVTVYTYYGSRLKGIEVGESFYASVITKKTTLKSESSGTVWETDPTIGEVALSYRDLVFGSANLPARDLEDIRKHRYSIQVKCKKAGWYEPGVPEIVMTIPKREEIDFWRDACNGLGREIRFDERHEPYAEKASELYNDHRRAERAAGCSLPKWSQVVRIYLGENKPCELGEINPALSFIPTPKGSKAKPHIAISTGETIIKEVSARSYYYNEIIENWDNTLLGACVEENNRNYGEPQTYRLLLFFKKEQS